MPKQEEKRYEVRVSNNYKQPTINGKPPMNKNGERLPIMVLVAFPESKTAKKDFKFFGDDSVLMSEQEMLSACYLPVPASIAEAERENNPNNVNGKGWIKNPNLVIQEVN